MRFFIHTFFAMIFIAVWGLSYASGEKEIVLGQPLPAEQEAKPSRWRTLLAKIRRKKSSPEADGYEQVMDRRSPMVKDFEATAAPSSPFSLVLLAGPATPSDGSDRRTPRKSPGSDTAANVPPSSPGSLLPPRYVAAQQTQQLPAEKL